MINTITLKRMEGSHKELSDFKKGKRFDSVEAAESELKRMSGTVPEEGHKVAYEVELLDGTRLYGSMLLKPLSVNLLPIQVYGDYGIDLREGQL